ncbi:TadE/TadG family type IV pilus assembly protein [Serinicoccus kebangsaanensis]|uniref:TadE/TadG family type IV pilus assembly protein n=1 Tax=Serinicoccus kebangsaanensis TaxID=2602069 RepID=UPI00124ED501|nr:TadE/TadG family type IV pilus assembly protein [Serinicoccus kebangsaanensis]
MTAHTASRSARSGRDRGSVAVEVAGFLPIFAILVFVIVNAVAMVSAVDATNQAARNAARAASMQQSPQAAAAQALPSWAQLKSVNTGGCSEQCVEVTASVPVGVPNVFTLTRVDITRDAVFPRTN